MASKFDVTFLMYHLFVTDSPTLRGKQYVRDTVKICILIKLQRHGQNEGKLDNTKMDFKGIRGKTVLTEEAFKETLAKGK